MEVGASPNRIPFESINRHTLLSPCPIASQLHRLLLSTSRQFLRRHLLRFLRARKFVIPACPLTLVRSVHLTWPCTFPPGQPALSSELTICHLRGRRSIVAPFAGCGRGTGFPLVPASQEKCANCDESEQGDDADDYACYCATRKTRVR